MPDSPHPTPATTPPEPHRWRRPLLVALVTALVVAPAAVWASDGFDDVAETDTFHDDIAWLTDTGVTLGCNPPENSRFCPDETVTREQMAAFLHRLAENQVVDAGTVAGKDASQVLTSASGKRGSVWACDHNAGPTYDPVAACGNGYNSSGGSIAVTRTDVGDYTVTFTDLGIEGGGPGHSSGTVQVTAQSGFPLFCIALGHNFTSDRDVEIAVRCYDFEGAETDSRFYVDFVY